MKGKILVLSLAILALSIAGSATTLSYFTDADSSVASFTVGKVKIRTITASIGRWSDEVQHSDAELIENSSGYAEYQQKECSNMLGEVDKPAVCQRNVFVQNTGTVAAYVRIKVQVPTQLLINGVGIVDGGSREYSITGPQGFSDTVRCPSGTCYEYTYTKSAPLAAGAMTSNPALTGISYAGVAMTSAEENEEEGSSQGLDLTQSGIRIYTQAIQAQGFSSAAEAFSQYK